MQQLMNWILMVIKWPMALLMVILLVPAIFATFFCVQLLVQSSLLTTFFFPLAFLCTFWVLFLRGSGTSVFAIFEHEITHMFFALLTFHKPVSLEVHHNKGGFFGFQGKGNWLITIAPYFFPTFPFLIMLGSILYYFTNQPIPNGLFAILGFATGYHICTTIVSIHPEQPDFFSAGRLFSFLFLPAANLICYGLIFAFVLRSWEGVSAYMTILLQNGILLLQNIGGFIQNFLYNFYYQ